MKNPGTSVWLSVDPMFFKHIGISHKGALLNPIIGLTNDGFIIFGDQDIYGNESSSGWAKGVAIFDAATFGMVKGAKYIPSTGKYLSKSFVKWADWGNKATTGYSVFDPPVITPLINIFTDSNEEEKK